MKCSISPQTEELFHLAAQQPDPEAFLDEMIDIASRMLRGERFEDEDFIKWKRERGYC